MIAFRVRPDMIKLHRVMEEYKKIMKYTSKCISYKMSSEELEIYLKTFSKKNKLRI